jgi:hypothetical protein
VEKDGGSQEHLPGALWERGRYTQGIEDAKPMRKKRPLRAK